MHLGVIYMTNHQSAVRGRPTPLTHRRSQPRLSQKSERPRAIRAARAHLLILPPYSPDLNPIEQAFAKIKHRLWNAAARSWEALWRAVGEVLDDIELQGCANNLRSAGFGSN